MEHLRDWTLCLDSPSKHSYVGSFYNPPEKMSHQLCANAVPLRQDKAKKAINLREISAQTYQTTPDAGSRAVLAALKTLQEKMRRLELERVQAERNVEQFSQAARQNASSPAHPEQQSSAREEDSSRRKELVSQLHSAETRCSLLEKQLDYMRKMGESAERERITSVNRQESRQQNERSFTDPQIQAQLRKLDRLEKECLKLTNTQSETERKIELLEQKLLEEEHERKLVQEKAKELQRELEANLVTLSAVEVKPKKKKSKEKALNKKSARTEVPVTQYLPKAKHMPFVAGTSTSPSHSVNANIQSVLHLMKTRQPRLCERVRTLQSGTENSKSPCQAPLSPSEGAAALGSLSELLLALQDELGQMSFEHQELVRQIDETDQRELREDLERELDCLVRRMEEKATQISKLRKHQQTVQKLSQCSPKKKQRPKRLASADGQNLAGGLSGVRALPCSPVKVSASKGQSHRTVSKERLQLLRGAQKLHSSLRQQDINWET
ncbi:centrosomal protein CEP57L1 isoform X1 [Colossoma macropomum]|uniref:centrosomal protein CEP57L1 isoform X1 n=2 Tax=Colossoma macropomum TaxID=42526 RepID=UPI0018649679|nr:centrosomal protein CEP57L1 isoform X1 [Colossoma macropomum]